MTHTVYLSLGSNLGDRIDNLKRALAALRAAGMKPTRVSSFYETEPVDFVDQPWFVNCAAQTQTDLTPVDLLRAMQTIETQMGRLKSAPKGPRLVDLDILLYGNETIDAPELQIPHPRMHLRRFVLVPLNEIAPEARHPGLNMTIADLLVWVADTSKVRLLAASG